MPRDYPEYEDESPEETYRDPLKPFLIALVVLLLLFAAIIVLLYMRLQTANTRAETLSQELTAVQVQLDDLRAQRAAEMPTPTPTEAPTPTPEPTPEPTATPEPTPEPSPTPAPLLRDTITAEMLGYVYRPADEFWYDEAKTAAVIPYMLAVHYGPGMDWGENMALNMGDTVEILAKQNGWVLLRTADGRYGWAAGELLRETADAPAATATPAAPVNPADPAVPVAPATAAPAAAPTPDYTEVSNPDLKSGHTKNPLSALCRERIFFYDGQRRERRRGCSYSLLSGTITVAK